MTGSTRFPDGFLWGAATSAWQIEGSPLADGAGLSNWDVFAHQPGRMFAGQTGDVACDHYRRWESDVDLMSALGLQAYRFSIRWARVQPGGRGAPNPKGLAFYGRLVDRLLERGIQPMVTLCHWDLPAEIADRGGRLQPDIAHRCADYSRAVFTALGDRVQTWVTLNEPWVMADAGFLHGVHPPALCDAAATARAADRMMPAHGAALRGYRD